MKLTRREFVGTSILGASVLAGNANEEKQKPEPTAQVTLGKTGIQASRLAMGTGMRGGRRESNQTRLGQKKFTDLMMHGHEQGINFFDMADLYGSHPYMKNALSEIPRDKYVLLTKIWFRRHLENNVRDRAKPNIERFCKELGTEYIDIALVHCVTNKSWPSNLERMRDEMEELKDKGILRAVGCSCHSLDALKVAAEHPWVDVILARINNTGNKMDADPKTVSKVLNTARKNGKGIVGMKIYGEGTLVEEKQRYESLKFVMDNQLIDAMTIGYEKPEHIDQTINHLNQILKA